ncbi:hypothetical protein GCK72_015488 [Caenorhabditis remanei]|uniref:Uncharacterized protein n=1 Tax=Caenorhabditis remanei TaxID=31234 RepID=A0A6A5GU75_CAERE|nr:hypothetical protein GCK72_015488 [Caenorhabditis remanei]KAF1759028.1 hypothetical protein GCK72_015488 [Caenorhabditis remanei]
MFRFRLVTNKEKYGKDSTTMGSMKKGQGDVVDALGLILDKLFDEDKKDYQDYQFEDHKFPATGQLLLRAPHTTKIRSGQFVLKAPHNVIIQIETRRFTGRHEEHEAIQINVEEKMQHLDHEDIRKLTENLKALGKAISEFEELLLHDIVMDVGLIDSALHWLRTKFYWIFIIGGAVLVSIVVFFVLAYCCSC